MELVNTIIERIEQNPTLDKVAAPVVSNASKLVKPTVTRNLLSGTALGHPAHPMLTDLPIGAWGSAVLLDLVGGVRARPAADLLVKAGIVSALPAIATGLNDLSDTYGPETRVGIVHAGSVAAGVVAFTLSARCRGRGNRGRAKFLGLLGMGAVAAGGFLGGHLSFTKGVNVNRVAHEYGPSDWTAVLGDEELADGEHRKVDAGGTAVLVWRDGALIWAISNTCSHMGGPLDEGAFDHGHVTCPWHGSVFRVRDGGIERGPACVTQPVYEARVHDGQIEVRSKA